MEVFQTISILFLNAFVVLFCYLQLYFWEIILAGIIGVCFVIECKEKDHHYVHDDRTVI